MRTPTAKDLGLRLTPRCFNMAKVSLALCPGARMAAPTGNSSPSLRISPVSSPRLITRSVTLVEKRKLPPRRIISSRRLSTTLRRTSVPMWGLATYKISSGAPNCTKVSKTKRLRPSLSLTRVFSFPSEKVPAPPSPNWTLDSGSKAPPCQKASTSAVLSRTGFPRSKTTGQ